MIETMKNKRNEKGISQQRLSDMCNVTKATINRIENGKQLPRPALMRKIAAVLGAEASTLYEEWERGNENDNDGID